MFGSYFYVYFVRGVSGVDCCSCICSVGACLVIVLVSILLREVWFLVLYLFL